MSGILISGDTRGGVGGPPRKPAATAPGAFKAAVAGVLTKLQQAWNKADAKAVGALFGKEADYVNMSGGHVTGADKIAVAHKALFDSSKGAQTAYRVIKLKPLGADVVMAFLGQQMTFKAGGKDQVIKTRPTMVLRKAGNGWAIASFQVTRVGAAAGGGGGGAKAAAGKAAPAAAAKAAPAKAAPAKAAAKKADKK